MTACAVGAAGKAAWSFVGRMSRRVTRMMVPSSCSCRPRGPICRRSPGDRTAAPGEAQVRLTGLDAQQTLEHGQRRPRLVVRADEAGVPGAVIVLGAHA